MAASAEEVVDNLFRDGPLSRHMDAMQDLFPMLKNKAKISPHEGMECRQRATPRTRHLGCVGCE
jgi:hypothetical protein